MDYTFIVATYKVIQDIEAEDKLIGPLTLRQFVYAGSAAILLYLCYFVASRGLAFMIAVFLPPALALGFFAFPWGRDQPTELWALAKIRFMLKPRKRIWDQSGIKELVTITAPKRIEQMPINQISQTEVRSRLRALADTIDSRGWAVKNAAINAYAAPQLMLQQPGDSDRLIDVSPVAPATAIDAGVQDADDMLDEQANPHARQVDSMISAASQAHRQKLLSELSNSEPAAQAPAQPAPNYWFLNQPSQPVSAPIGTVTFNTQVVAPHQDATNAQQTPTTQDEAALARELEARKPTASYYGHLHTIQPLSAQQKQPAAVPAPPVPQQVPPTTNAAPAKTQPQAAPPQVTPGNQAAILQLARNDDLNVATIAREAQRANPDDEVVIKLH